MIVPCTSSSLSSPLTARVVWGTTDDFATSFLHFSLFFTALWDLPNSRPVHSLMLSCHLIFCPPCLLPPFTVPCKMVLARPDEREIWPYQCSLRLFTIVRRSSLHTGTWTLQSVGTSATLTSVCVSHSYVSVRSLVVSRKQTAWNLSRNRKQTVWNF